MDALRCVLLEQHRLGGSQGLKLFVGESESDESFIKPEVLTRTSNPSPNL